MNGQTNRQLNGAPVEGAQRLVTLDFIRGVAVLGILFANIVAFSHPFIAYGWPGGLGAPMSGADKAVWLAQYLLIDGKMRGLFTLLFGAGMALFMERAWARGETHWLQIRRLLWLGAFGLAHFFLLFWGDILFLYAIAGLVALPFVTLPAQALLRTGIVWYVSAAIYLAASFSGTVTLEQSAAAQQQAPADHAAIEQAWGARMDEAQRERAAFTQGSYAAELRFTAQERSAILSNYPAFALLETIPIMLIGMALLRFGFFSGAIDPVAMRRWGWAGVLGGAALSLPLGLWAMETGFSPWLTEFVANDAAQLPRLAMIVGLAALLAAWAPRAAQGWLGQRLVAAGRMAFSNYIGTSLLMMLVFRHWAGGLWGELGRVELLGPLLLGWIAMLAWSQPWLARFRYGPLEWLWRCLTYWKLFPMGR